MVTRAPLRIESLTIRDFRGIDHLELSLVGDIADERVTVVLGDNGCGKTAVLEAIAIALGQHDVLPSDQAPFAEQVRFGASEFVLEARVRSGNERIDLTMTSNLAPAPIRRMGTIGGSERDFPNGPTWQNIEKLAPSVEYFSARRDPERLGTTPSRSGAVSARESMRIISLKRSLQSVYIRSLRGRSDELDAPTSPFARIQRFARRFLGPRATLDLLQVSNEQDADFDVVVRYGDLPIDITSLAMARAQAAGGRDLPRIVPINRLSSGQLALFGFAGPLVFRDRPADVVLVDEPETHMHLQWQRVILRALAELSPESQFVVATQSSEVARGVSHERRMYLVADDDPRGGASKLRLRSGERPEDA